MTATLTHLSTPASSPTPEARGVTRIADRVIEKIAARAACEVNDVRPAAVTGLARLAHRSTDPAASAHVDGTTVSLDIQLAISYPSPIRTIAANVHRAVRSTVERLAGLDVVTIRIEVVDLPIDRPSARRVV
jgi:uncharacterized alkaline shock family protein YloU